MPYIPQDIVSKAREMDLLTYLQNYEPQELVHFGGGTYCTREHDSLKISNGKWCWFSHGVGGRSALDYLIKVKGIPFMEAVEKIVGQTKTQPPVFVSGVKENKPKTLLLPKARRCATHAVEYLHGRGIDRVIIDYCIKAGRIYESYPYHNVVFVGQDNDGKARYANLRGIDTHFKGEAEGSDKRFSFSIPTENCDTVHLFESAIDLLSFATLQKLDGKPWNSEHLVSLAGVYKPKKDAEESTLPLALGQFLKDHPEVKHVNLRLDNDPAGRIAMSTIYKLLTDKYDVCPLPPLSGKDYNDTLCDRLGLQRTVSYGKTKSR